MSKRSVVPRERKPVGPHVHAERLMGELRRMVPDVEWSDVEDELTDMVWRCFADAQRLFALSKGGRK